MFEEVADLLEIQSANPFRIRAYRAAARTIGTLNTPVESLVEKDGGALAELPGIGADLAGKIIVLCRTGKLPLLNQGELEAARAHRLPRLVELGDIRGDLQMHTTSTDGHDTLAEMVEACAGRGYEHIAITDHTKAVRVAGGLTKADLRRQSREIDKVQRRFKDIVIFKSAEVDILDDGSLDLDDEMLSELDVVLVVISTDAHRVEELAFMRHGVDQARRGWCEAEDVANTLSVDRFRNLIAR